MSTSTFSDFQQILAQPSQTYEEGLRFFRGEGLMNQTLKQLALDLEARGIAYCVIGAVALNQHGYPRFTADIDLLMKRDGLEKFARELVGRGYRPAFEGATRKFRATAHNVPIEIRLTGEFPGDGKPKSVVFPDPTRFSTAIDGICTLTLEKLVELKLASGLSGLGRRKDLADVQELIRVRALGVDFAQNLDASVRPMFQELHAELVQGALQDEAPDRD